MNIDDVKYLDRGHYDVYLCVDRKINPAFQHAIDRFNGGARDFGVQPARMITGKELKTYLEFTMVKI